MYQLLTRDRFSFNYITAEECFIGRVDEDSFETYFLKAEYRKILRLFDFL